MVDLLWIVGALLAWFAILFALQAAGVVFAAVMLVVSWPVRRVYRIARHRP